jgi:hypothetical protein
MGKKISLTKRLVVGGALPVVGFGALAGCSDPPAPLSPDQAALPGNTGIVQQDPQRAARLEAEYARCDTRYGVPSEPAKQTPGTDAAILSQRRALVSCYGEAAQGLRWTGEQYKDGEAIRNAAKLLGGQEAQIRTEIGNLVLGTGTVPPGSDLGAVLSDKDADALRKAYGSCPSPGEPNFRPDVSDHFPLAQQQTELRAQKTCQADAATSVAAVTSDELARLTLVNTANVLQDEADEHGRKYEFHADRAPDD